MEDSIRMPRTERITTQILPRKWELTLLEKSCFAMIWLSFLTKDLWGRWLCTGLLITTVNLPFGKLHSVPWWKEITTNVKGSLVVLLKPHQKHLELQQLQ